MKINKLFIMLIIGISLLLASCSGDVSPESPSPSGVEGVPVVEDEEVILEGLKVGVILPLTGDAALYGEETLKAIDLAKDTLGRNIDLVVEDGECTGPGSSAAANKLVNVDGVKYILGGVCSSETLAAAPIVEEGKVILISSASTSSEITDAGDYVFRTVPSNAFQGRLMAEFSNEMGWNEIFVLYENTDYGLDLAEAFKDRALELGISVVAFESHKQEETNFRPVIEKILGSEMSALYYVPQSQTSAQTFGAQLREKQAKIQILGSETLSGSEIAEEYGDVYDGVFVASPKFDESSQKYQEFLSLWEEKYEEPFENKMGVLLYYLAAYENFILVSDMLESCGDDTECAKNFLYIIENRVGMFGTYSIDENGDISNAQYEIKQLKDNKFQTYR